MPVTPPNPQFLQALPKVSPMVSFPYSKPSNDFPTARKSQPYSTNKSLGPALLPPSDLKALGWALWDPALFSRPLPTLPAAPASLLSSGPRHSTWRLCPPTSHRAGFLQAPPNPRGHRHSLPCFSCSAGTALFMCWCLWSRMLAEGQPGLLLGHHSVLVPGTWRVPQRHLWTK